MLTSIPAARPRFHGFTTALIPGIASFSARTDGKHPETTRGRANFTSPETNGRSKAGEEEGQQKVERQRDGKEAAVERRGWGKNCDRVRRRFSLIFLAHGKSEKVQVWVRGAEAPHASAENHVSSADGGGGNAPFRSD